jgi:hypothetical protein
VDAQVNKERISNSGEINKHRKVQGICAPRLLPRYKLAYNKFDRALTCLQICLLTNTRSCSIAEDHLTPTVLEPTHSTVLKFVLWPVHIITCTVKRKRGLLIISLFFRLQGVGVYNLYSICLVLAKQYNNRRSAIGIGYCSGGCPLGYSVCHFICFYEAAY